MRHEGFQQCIRAKHPCPQTWVAVVRGSLWDELPLHMPAECKNPAPASVPNAGGIAPVQSPPWVSISSVGVAGQPGILLTLKPSLGSCVTSASDSNKLLFQITERGMEKIRDKRVGGWLTYLLQPKVGMGLFLTQSGMYLLFPLRGSEELPLRHLLQQHQQLCKAMVSTQSRKLQREQAQSR